MKWKDSSLAIGIFIVFLTVVSAVACSNKTGNSMPWECGQNTCNEIVGGGVCDDSSGQAECTCNEGYTGANCDQCEDGFTSNGDACLPLECGDNTCNEIVGGGVCDDSSGQALCKCNKGYVGPNCLQCADGYEQSESGACFPVENVAQCEPAEDGEGGDVEAPILRQTLPASWDENWFASPVVADLDADGENEIIAARHSVLYVWSISGDLIWRSAFGHNSSDADDHGSSRMWASPVVGDFDSDGDLEIAVGSDADSSLGVNIAIYDHTGMLLQGWPQVFGNSEIRSIAGGDLDGDGFYEIVVNKTNEGPATAVYNIDGTLRDGWPQVNNATCDPPDTYEPCWDFGGYNQNIAVADVDRDGYLDVISSYDAIAFGVFDRDGNPFATQESFSDMYITSVEAYHDLTLSQQGWGTGDRSEFTYSPPVVADIDQDGDMEFVLVGDHEHSSSTDNQGVTFWVLNHDMTRPAGWEWPKDTGMSQGEGSDHGPNLVSTRPNPAVADIDGDPGLEIIAPAYDGYLYAFAADGTLLWSYLFGTGPAPYEGASEPLITDLNGDGLPEIIFVTMTSGESGSPETPAHMIILDNQGNQLHKIEIYSRGSMASPTIADLDGDGDLELILSLKDTLGAGDGGVQIWDIPNSKTNCMPWPTARGNNLRQGYVRN